MSEQIEILRRIAEAGMGEIRKNGDWQYVDIFQHMLDEIQRLKIMNQANST